MFYHIPLVAAKNRCGPDPNLSVGTQNDWHGAQKLPPLCVSIKRHCYYFLGVEHATYDVQVRGTGRPIADSYCDLECCEKLDEDS